MKYSRHPAPWNRNWAAHRPIVCKVATLFRGFGIERKSNQNVNLVRNYFVSIRIFKAFAAFSAGQIKKRKSPSPPWIFGVYWLVVLVLLPTLCPVHFVYSNKHKFGTARLRLPLNPQKYLNVYVCTGFKNGDPTSVAAVNAPHKLCITFWPVNGFKFSCVFCWGGKLAHKLPSIRGFCGFPPHFWPQQITFGFSAKI